MSYIYVIYIYIYMEHLFLKFLDHTQWRSTVGRTPLDEWSARRRDLYLTTHDTHKRQISMPPVGFEPKIAAGERPQAARLLRSWVRIPPGAWIFVCCECRVLSGRGLCDELITRPEESCRLWCVVVCDLETSRMGAPYIYDISHLRVNKLTSCWGHCIKQGELPCTQQKYYFFSFSCFLSWINLTKCSALKNAVK